MTNIDCVSNSANYLNFKVVINSIGILLNIIGALILLLKSPLHYDVIDAGGAIDNWSKTTRNTFNKNMWIKIGGYTIIGGSGLQLISNFLPG